MRILCLIAAYDYNFMKHPRWGKGAILPRQGHQKGARHPSPCGTSLCQPTQMGPYRALGPGREASLHI